MCGSLYVDLNFERWLEQTFGDKYTSVPISKRGPESKFHASFESAKRNFSGLEKSQRGYEIGPIKMDWYDESNYDDDELAVKISRYKGST